MSIVYDSLVFIRSRNRAHSSTYESKTIFQCCSFDTNGISILTSYFATMSCVHPVYNLITNHAKFWHRSSKNKKDVGISAQVSKRLQHYTQAFGSIANCSIAASEHRRYCWCVSKPRNVPLFHSEIGFTFGWVFIRERKLFIRRVRKRKISRPVCIVKQNKLFFVYDFFY